MLQPESLFIQKQKREKSHCQQFPCQTELSVFFQLPEVQCQNTKGKQQRQHDAQGNVAGMNLPCLSHGKTDARLLPQGVLPGKHAEKFIDQQKARWQKTRAEKQRVFPVGKPGTAETVKECDTHYRKQDKVETRFGKSCQKTENGKKHRLFHRDFLLIDLCHFRRQEKADNGKRTHCQVCGIPVRIGCQNPAAPVNIVVAEYLFPFWPEIHGHEKKRKNQGRDHAVPEKIPVYALPFGIGFQFSSKVIFQQNHTERVQKHGGKGHRCLRGDYRRPDSGQPEKEPVREFITAFQSFCLQNICLHVREICPLIFYGLPVKKHQHHRGIQQKQCGENQLIRPLSATCPLFPVCHAASLPCAGHLPFFFTLKPKVPNDSPHT